MTKKDYQLIVEKVAYNYNSMLLNLKLTPMKKRIVADSHLSLLHLFAGEFSLSNPRFNGQKFYDYFIKQLQEKMPKDLLKSAENLITKL
jgi:hypothetical protein